MQCLMILQVSQSEDVESAAAEEKMLEGQQQDLGNISSQLRKSSLQILAAQFECYLKIITDPPRTEGDKRLRLRRC